MNDSFFQLPDNKRNAIINAGFRVFSQYTYKKSPMSEIAAEAGISKSLLFYYFRNKADSLGLKKEKLADGLDLELMYKDMYYASEGYLWEKLQSNDIDPDKMEKDFVRMIGFWRKLYSRKNYEE